jgi:hypothetical protein
MGGAAQRPDTSTPRSEGSPVAIVSLVLLVVGWAVILIGAFGTGIDITVGNLDPLTTGIVFVLGGLTLRVMD